MWDQAEADRMNREREARGPTPPPFLNGMSALPTGNSPAPQPSNTSIKGVDYNLLLKSLQESPLSATERANYGAPSQNLGLTNWDNPNLSDQQVQQAYQAAWGRAAQPWEIEAWQGDRKSVV